MIKEFLEFFKIKDIVFFVLIIVLFMMILKKNKKEDFAGQISDANLQAIKNLGDFAAGLKSGGTYKFPGTTLEANSIKIGNVTVNEAYLNTLAKKSEILSAVDKSYLTNFINYRSTPILRVSDNNLNATFEEAKTRCLNKGRVIASKQDVIDSGIKYNPNIGHKGAYISDGTEGYVNSTTGSWSSSVDWYDVTSIYSSKGKSWCKLPGL
jgi:hypothetical protein